MLTDFQNSFTKTPSSELVRSFPLVSTSLHCHLKFLGAKNYRAPELSEDSDSDIRNVTKHIYPVTFASFGSLMKKYSQ